MSDTPLDDRFARFAATGDEALRNELVLEHQGLAIAFARRYARTGSDNDLEQIALEALIHAINRFDPEREVRFSTYAARVIDGRLKQHFRDDGWDIRVPRSIKQLAVAVRSTTSELTNELGRVPSPAELADRLGVTVDQIALALDAANAHRADELDPIHLATRHGMRRHRPRCARTARRTTRAGTRVVSLRFYGELSQSQIAERIGVSQMQVSRLLRRALTRLRTKIGDA